MERERPRIGVFICHCGLNIAPRVDVAEVARASADLEYVETSKEYRFMCSSPGQEMIIQAVAEHQLNRVVVASCSPRMHEPTFQKAAAAAGLNPFQFQMANIREHVSWVTPDSEKATAKAKALVRAAVARVARHQPLMVREVPVHKSVLVVGGGVAGMQAALTAADAGFKVHLVEREPSLGGHMALFDKTFPTLDCAACTMTPKMAAVSRHENIEVHTWSELEKLDGFVGNYRAVIRKKARYIKEDVCSGCGLCAESCPTKKVVDEFNQGLSFRTAVYKLFPQAVPGVYTIDSRHCLYLTKGKCRVCEKKCPAGAVDFTDRDREITLDVGAVILATGFKAFDPSPLFRYGFGRYPEVYTSLQFERMNNATGPTAGEIRTKDGRTPKKVAIIHCVGSRDAATHKYCSRVCCLYSMKFAHLVREKTGAEVYEFYIDLRTPGKGYEEFYNRVQEEGVQFIRGRVAEVTNVPDRPEDEGRLLVAAENTLAGRPARIAVDMVLLSVGLEPAQGSDQVGRLAGVARDADGWLNELHVKLAPVATASAGVYLAGCCQGPKDIPDTVAQASAAAGEAVALLARGTVRTKAEISRIDPDRCAGCRQCLTLCSYSAITYNERKKVAEVSEAVCQGCGACAAACPSGAAMVHHFQSRQILSEVEALLG